MTKWTPIEQGPPDNEGTYLVHFSDDTIETLHLWINDNWAEERFGMNQDIRITHWRELPEGP